MRIGVLGDTHGFLKTAIHAVWAMGTIDALIHTGDFYTDAIKLESLVEVPVYKVVGNCDAQNGPEILTLSFNNFKILVTHGHLFGVKLGLQKLYYKALETGCTAVVFGHTHIPLNLWENKILFFNPGSPVKPQPGHSAGFGVLEISHEEIKGKLYSINPE